MCTLARHPTRAAAPRPAFAQGFFIDPEARTRTHATARTQEAHLHALNPKLQTPNPNPASNLVSSKRRIAAVIGARNTAARHAAAPRAAKMLGSAIARLGMRLVRRPEYTAPAVAPKKSAGINVPPIRPEAAHEAVRATLITRSDASHPIG